MIRDRVCTTKNMARISTIELVETQIHENYNRTPSDPDERELEALRQALLRANQRSRVNRDILYNTFLLIFCLFSFYIGTFFLFIYFYT